MKLLVIRHGVAQDRYLFQSECDGHDDLRPLTSEGAKRMQKCAKRLGKLLNDPDVLASSPLVRALQTADILRASWQGMNVAVCEALRPEAPLDDFTKWLHHLPQAAPDALVAVVGHEPHLSKLVSWLCTGEERSFIEMKKGGVALLEFDGKVAKGQARLLWLAPPKLLFRT